MKITKSSLKKMILEAVDLDEPFMRGNDAITVTERKPSRHKGVQNGMPMELVIWKQIDTKTGTPGMGSMDIPQGMGLEEFFEAGEKEGFPDYYRKPETGADMNRAIKAAEERGDWDNRRRNEGKQIKITKKQIRKIIREVINLDIKKGDVILTGKFKNKRTIVKNVGKDKYGHPTINGKSILKFKIEKLLPKDKQSKKTQDQEA